MGKKEEGDFLSGLPELLLTGITAAIHSPSRVTTKKQSGQICQTWVLAEWYGKTPSNTW